METKKHIINLPKNKVAENISVKTENGQIVVNYDLKNIFDPKDGDFLIKSGFVFIYKNPINPCFYQKVCGCYCGQAESTLNVDKCSFWTDFEGCRYATESEKQAFLEKLKEAGYIWNAEKKCLEEYIWKPEKGKEYFFLGIDLKVYSNTYYDTYIDYSLISIGNCFKTEEQAEKKAKELREVLKKK